MGVLKAWDGTAWRNVGCTPTSTTGRLKLWTGSAWVVEKCAGGGSATVVDGFNRADALTLTTSGRTWTNTPAGTIGVKSNAAGRAGGSPALCQAVTDCGASDGVVQATLSSWAPGGSGAGIAFRYVDVSNYWLMQAYGQSGSGSNIYRLYRVQGGGLFNVVSATTTRPATGDVLAVEFAGSAITCRVNGTSVMTHSDATFSSSTLHGVFFDGTSLNPQRLDEWSFSPAVTGRPLKALIGGVWTEVACMVPA